MINIGKAKKISDIELIRPKKMRITWSLLKTLTRMISGFLIAPDCASAWNMLRCA